MSTGTLSIEQTIRESMLAGAEFVLRAIQRPHQTKVAVSNDYLESLAEAREAVAHIKEGVEHGRQV